MAAIPKLQFKNGHAPELPLFVEIEALPFPAAMLDGDVVFAAVNREWLVAHPTARPGESCLSWCESVHADPGLRAELLTGVQRVFANVEQRFVQEYSDGDSRYRITISPCSAGALIVFEEYGPASEPEGRESTRNRQSQKMETIGRLVGGVAHDFANLLTLITGYSEILLNRTGENDPLRPELEEIQKAVSRGSRLTAQLLGYTRGQPVEAKAVDLNGVIADMQGMLRPIIGEYIRLETALSPNLGRVVADPGQMEQVIMNLVLNARDAMPTGGGIRIETANGELDEHAAQTYGMHAGPCVMLTIADTGHGIEPEMIQHVFEPFFTTKEDGKGTGLGLSTVHSVVKHTGGDVWVRSTPGQGTAFTICLPRAGEHAEAREPRSAPQTAARGSETVLVVEDEDGVRKLLTYVLRKRGYEVLEASGPEEALAIFEKHAADIHLVLTDMIMPGMSGRELAEKLQQIRPEMKMMFMSGYTDDVLVRTGALSPGMSFLAKPLRPDVLAAKVREALDSPPRPFNPR
jgi:two-component system cell cycle sensor histidine kinase/response regulator CckA